MKLVTVLVVVVSSLSPGSYGVAYARRFYDYLATSSASMVYESHERHIGRPDRPDQPADSQAPQRPPELSDPFATVYQVARAEGRGVADEDDECDDGVLRGVELSLNLQNNEGFALVRDDVAYPMITRMFDVLACLGWHQVEDDDGGVEPHEFEDGGYGVKIWLYRMERPIAAILRDMKAA